MEGVAEVVWVPSRPAQVGSSERGSRAIAIEPSWEHRLGQPSPSILNRPRRSNKREPSPAWARRVGPTPAGATPSRSALRDPQRPAAPIHTNVRWQAGRPTSSLPGRPPHERAARAGGVEPSGVTIGRHRPALWELPDRAERAQWRVWRRWCGSLRAPPRSAPASAARARSPSSDRGSTASDNPPRPS